MYIIVMRENDLLKCLIVQVTLEFRVTVSGLKLTNTVVQHPHSDDLDTKQVLKQCL